MKYHLKCDLMKQVMEFNTYENLKKAAHEFPG